METEDGPITIEDLQIGDRVYTMDHGYRPIRWIGSRSVERNDSFRNPNLLPVVITAGSLGMRLPEVDLMVSWQHRVLVRSPIAQRMFGIKEILIPAIRLISLEGVQVAYDIDSITYWHILLNEHEVIFLNGAPTETIFTGPSALNSVTYEQREEIETLFPQLIQGDVLPKPARYIPDKCAEIRQPISRHVKTGKMVLQEIS